MLSLIFIFFNLVIIFNGPTMADQSRKLAGIQTSSKLPFPLPNWPPGGGFAGGTIDLGGLQVSQVSTFNKIWAANEGGFNDLGATFYDPVLIPQGFSILGSYGQPNYMPLDGHVLVGNDITNDTSNPTLKPPIGYTLVWSSQSLNIKKEGDGFIWFPNPPDGYRAVGYVVTNSSEKPTFDRVRCVRSDLTDSLKSDGNWIWGPSTSINVNGFNVYGSRPTNRGVGAMGASLGGFVVQNGIGGTTLSLASLKNLKGSLGSLMPNLKQIETLIQTYSPVVYFHPNEPYLPTSVDWFFQNGALVYHKGDESNPNPINPNGSNLPQGGSNDDTYWLDLPKDGSKEKVKKGNLQTANAYFHIKPMYGGFFTDIATWVFYPFNGASRAKVEFVNISLGKIGEHVGDWEHVTLRINNFNGELHSMFFSQHSWGTWVSAWDLEYASGNNKPIVYSSLNGHSSYPKPGLVLIGPVGVNIGLRDDTAKGDKMMDTGLRATVVAAEYLGSAVVEPPWLNYFRKWGPKIEYDLDKEINKVEKIMIGKLKKAFEKIVKSIPREVLGEEGPTGPKVKNNWGGDEM
ncbi:hypothetical protein L6452_20165 [Arctium lappa]|uniref:Uncharacterized protein n=1 Tax=Arctium lappa TaxID=4217 RepID=A0ACB9BAP1_ARCLA|nr:hypothetical protein L6452_20165 [Arctium lappa]